MAEETIIEVSGLGKTVPEIGGGQPLVILQDISFAVTRGESLSIVGASGSGKSTLLGLLAGLDTPSAGDVHLAGTALNSLDEDERASLRGRLLGFVFQSFLLLPALNALENVMLPLDLAGYRAKEAQALARAWLERVGLGERLAHYPLQLSGGEQQRVALARAFAPAPLLILADEPTGNLDAETGRKIADLMFALNEKEGTTLVLVTHDESIARRSRRVMRLESGRLAADFRNPLENMAKDVIE
jgi:putative ABC transport system ATP-binding protein